MAKMTKAERSRSAARRKKQSELNFQQGIADTVGFASGAYLAGRMALTGRPLAGPLTVGAAVGLAGAAAKLLLPAVDKTPALSGLTSGMLAVGAVELSVLGAAHRIAAGS
jgi:hypothetical protein